MPTRRQEDATAILVDIGKLPTAPTANHRDMTSGSMAIPTGRCAQMFKECRATWKTLLVTELK